MSQGLRERFFPVHEEEFDRKLDAFRTEAFESVSSLVSAKGWTEFKFRVQKLIDTCEIRPGGENEMLYQIGQRDALRKLQSVLLSIEQEIRNERRERP